MIQPKINRISLLFLFIGVILVWDFTVSERSLDPTKVPYPFALIEAFGRVDFLRGFGWFLRRLILIWLAGFLLGVGTASLIRRSSSLTDSVLKFLRFGMWFPFLLFFATPGVFFLGITAVLFASCYSYLLARTRFDMPSEAIRPYIIKETLLQALLFSLIVELWFPVWTIYRFPQLKSATMGLGVNAVIMILITSIIFFFKFDFKTISALRGAVLKEEFSTRRWQSTALAFLWGGLFFAAWFTLSSFGLVFYRSSPPDVIMGAARLFGSGEIFTDIAMSLMEVVTGIALGGLPAFFAALALKTGGKLGKVLLHAIPLSYAFPITLWLLGFLLVPLPLFLERTLLIALLTFYPFVETTFGLSDTSPMVQLLSGVESALPIAFVAAFVGEAYASTAGIGFLMTVASATFQTHYALVGVFAAVILIVGLSALFRVIARRQFLPVSNAAA